MIRAQRRQISGSQSIALLSSSLLRSFSSRLRFAGSDWSDKSSSSNTPVVSRNTIPAYPTLQLRATPAG